MLYNKCRTTRLRLQLYTSSLCISLCHVVFQKQSEQFHLCFLCGRWYISRNNYFNFEWKSETVERQTYPTQVWSGSVDPAYWSQTSLKCILASSKGDWLNYFAVSNSRNFAISFTVQDSNRQPPSAAADSSVKKKLRYKAKQPICRLYTIFLPLLGTCSLVFRVVLRFMWM